MSSHSLQAVAAGRALARILVAGGLYEEEEDEALARGRAQFAEALGRKIVAQGHVLLGGCRTELDAKVAEAAAEGGRLQGLPDRELIQEVDSDGKP